MNTMYIISMALLICSHSLGAMNALMNKQQELGPGQRTPQLQQSLSKRRLESTQKDIDKLISNKAQMMEKASVIVTKTYEFNDKLQRKVPGFSNAQDTSASFAKLAIENLTRGFQTSMVWEGNLVKELNDSKENPGFDQELQTQITQLMLQTEPAQLTAAAIKKSAEDYKASLNKLNGHAPELGLPEKSLKDWQETQAHETEQNAKELAAYKGDQAIKNYAADWHTAENQAYLAVIAKLPQ